MTFYVWDSYIHQYSAIIFSFHYYNDVIIGSIYCVYIIHQSLIGERQTPQKCLI